MNGYKHIIDCSIGRLCNQLFELSEALINYNHIDIIELKNEDKNIHKLIDYSLLNKIEFPGINYINKNYNNYYQYYHLNREEVLKKYIKFPENIINGQEKYRGKTIIHIRRGDYLWEWNGNSNCYYTLSSNYIKYICDKYNFKNNIVVISDDILWCENNLSFLPNDTIYSKDDYLEDLYKITIAKNIVCSGSSFSIIGCLLNKNENKLCIGITPYDKFNKGNDKIYPPYFKLENIKIFL